MGLERANARRNEIREIEFEGTVTDDKHEVARAFFHYYEGLCAFRRVDLEAFKTEFHGAVRRIDAVSEERLEQPITPAEVEGAINKLNPGKSPGPDGLSATFYKAFKALVAPPLAVERKALPLSHAQVHTILLPESFKEALKDSAYA